MHVLLAKLRQNSVASKIEPNHKGTKAQNFICVLVPLWLILRDHHDAPRAQRLVAGGRGRR